MSIKMDQIIFTKSYEEPPVNRREILRYMRCNDSDSGIDKLLDECLDEILQALSYKVCWRIFPLKETENGLDLGFMQTESSGLIRNLHGCEGFVLFAATIGLGADRLIAKYGRVSPVKALCIQAIGAERIESLCDEFCEGLRQKYDAMGFAIRPRFSPGYGDFPLEAQRDVFRALDCHRKIGLSLNDSLLMSPSKSVSAIVGISAKVSKDTNAKESKGKILQNRLECHEDMPRCLSCQKRDCQFRDSN